MPARRHSILLSAHFEPSTSELNRVGQVIEALGADVVRSTRASAGPRATGRVTISGGCRRGRRRHDRRGARGDGSRGRGGRHAQGVAAVTADWPARDASTVPCAWAGRGPPGGRRRWPTASSGSASPSCGHATRLGKRQFEPYTGLRDVAVMHTVVDVSGVNDLVDRVYRQAAGYVVGGPGNARAGAGAVRPGRHPGR